MVHSQFGWHVPDGVTTALHWQTRYREEQGGINYWVSHENSYEQERVNVIITLYADGVCNAFGVCIYDPDLGELRPADMVNG